MAKAKSSGRVRIKGATKADKKTIAAARATTRADETPDAQPTTAAKKAAAERQFAKADAAGAATPEEGTLSRAVRGY